MYICVAIPSVLIRDHVRILIPGGLLVIDCLFLFLVTFLNPQISAKL